MITKFEKFTENIVFDDESKINIVSNTTKIPIQPIYGLLCDNFGSKLDYVVINKELGLYYVDVAIDEHENVPKLIENDIYILIYINEEEYGDYLMLRYQIKNKD